MHVVECTTLYKVQHKLKVVVIFLAFQLIYLCLFGHMSALAAPLAGSSDISLINGSTHTNITRTISGTTIIYAPIGNNATIGIGEVEDDLDNSLSVIITTTGIGTQNGNLTMGNGVSLSWSTSADLTMIANRQLRIRSGAIISTMEGNLTLDGNPNSITINSKFQGVLIEGELRSTGSGALTIRGHGGTKNNNNNGIEISGQINSTGTGNISISGTGGNGGGSNHGIKLFSSGQINSTGAGAISINGTGGDGTGKNNYGVTLASSGQINNTGTGTTAISGIGGGGTGNNFGINITGNSTAIHSTNSDISIVATGGNGSGLRHTGIRLSSGGYISGTNGVNITVVGNGGNGTGKSRGIHTTDDNSGIYSTNGNIQLIGTGGTGGSDNVGVYLQNGSQVRAFSSGHITLVGTGGAGDSEGVWRSGNTTTSRSGNIMITGARSGSSSDIYMGGEGIGDSTMTGDITLIGDTISFGNADEIRSTGNLLIQPTTPSRDIQIGGSTTTELQLGDGELGTIVDGFNSITIGDVANGTGDITIKTATFSDTITIAGGKIWDEGNTDIKAATNRVTLDGTISPGLLSLPGILKVIGNFHFAAGNAFDVEIGGASPGTATNRHDQIDVAGTVTIHNGVTLNTSAINSYVPTSGDIIVIINNDSNDAINGTFDSLAEGATVTVGGRDMLLSYVGGDGNDVVLGLPEIELWGNSRRISHGDNTPSTRDDTEFGSQAIGMSVIHTFTIKNSGKITLNLSLPITMSGPDASRFTASTISTISLAPAASTQFQVTFNPNVTNLQSATLGVSSNDHAQSPYIFDIQGRGITATSTITSAVTPTVTVTPTATITPTATVTLTATPTMTPTATLTMTPVITATSSPTITITSTTTPTITATLTLSATPTISASFTITPNSTVTVTPAATPTVIPVPTVTPSTMPSPTSTVPPIPVATPTATSTATSTPISTPTPTPSSTATPSGRVALRPAAIVVVESVESISLNLVLDRVLDKPVSVTLGSLIQLPHYATAAIDYSVGITTVTFLAGETFQSFSVKIIQDQAIEPNEQFRVFIREVQGGGAALAPDGSQSLITILDDDQPTVEPTASPTVEATFTATEMPSVVPAETSTPLSPTPLPPTPLPPTLLPPTPLSLTPTMTPQLIHTATPAGTAQPTASGEPSPTALSTATPVQTVTRVAKMTNTSTATASKTSLPMSTVTTTPMPSAVPSAVPSSVPKFTHTPLQTQTVANSTVMPLPTSTLTPALTSIPKPVLTPTLSSTPKPTDDSIATSTPMPVETATEISTATTSTATTSTATPMPTKTLIPTPIVTAMPTETPTVVPVPEMHLSLTVIPSSLDEQGRARAGYPIIFSLGVTNTGDVAVEKLIIEGVVPEYIFFESENSTQGWESIQSVQNNGQRRGRQVDASTQKKYSIVLGNMEPNQAIDGIRFAVQIDQGLLKGATSLSFSAMLLHDGQDLDVDADLTINIGSPTALVPGAEPQINKIFLPFISK